MKRRLRLLFVILVAVFVVYTLFLFSLLVPAEEEWVEKLPPTIREKLGCDGSIDLLILLHGGIDRGQIDRINVILENNLEIELGADIIHTSIDVSKIDDIASLTFVKKFEIYVAPSICPPGALNCGSDPFANLIC